MVPVKERGIWGIFIGQVANAANQHRRLRVFESVRRTGYRVGIVWVRVRAGHMSRNMKRIRLRVRASVKIMLRFAVNGLVGGAEPRTVLL